MTIINLKLDKPYRNIDQSTLTNNLYLLQDVYRDEAGAIHKRPGLLEYVDLGTSASIDGLFWWDFHEVYIVISGGNVYKVSDSNGTFTQIGTGIMQLANRVTFAEVYDITNSELRLFMANGGSIYYTNGTTCTIVSGSSAPTRCTHVFGIDTYLLCNDLDFPFLWRSSNVEDPTVIANAYDAQIISDKVNGLYGANGRVFVTGRKSIEPFYDSGDTTPFRKVNGALIESGTPTPYAFGVSGNIPFYFNTDREVVLLNGYSPVVISGAYGRRIHELSYTNDVEVDYVGGFGGRKWLLFSFNDANLTIVYDMVTEEWYEWGKWNVSEYNQFIGRCYAYSSSWNIHVIGNRADGKLYKMSEEYTSDGGATIRCEVVTGNYDHGKNDYKTSNALFVDIRRGDGITGSPYTSGKLQVQTRDNRSYTWGNQIEIDLGQIGQSEWLAAFRPMGRYRSRQYRFVFQDNSKFVMNGIQEDAS